ncbi:MAG: Ig-like domain-containing protein [Methanobrevibacter sp.]|nr:Ig-like domain-containing protein [Methanobrevibacter sp.]
MLSISAVAAFDTAAVSDDIETSDADEEPPSGSSLYASEIKSVSQDDYSLATTDISMYYKNGTRYEVTLMQGEIPVENASITININGINYTRTTGIDGKVSLAINLNPGNYSIYSTYNNLGLSSDVEVLPTTFGNDIVKIYRNDTQYTATFLDNNGNPLADTDVTFNINGVFYSRKTNESGVAKLNINLIAGQYIITSIGPNGFLHSNLVTVRSSINGSDVVKFYRNATQYKASFLDKSGKALANADVSFNINGVFYTRTTEETGVATLNINLLPASYILTAINPVNNDVYSNLITVIPTMIASDVYSEDENTCFDVILINGDGSVGANRYVSVNVDGQSYEVTTDSSGIACLELTLGNGVHDVLTTDPDNGLVRYNIINVSITENIALSNETLYYSEYGVSPDNLTIMAIGRPSASGELSQYGYKFYMTVFERVCPYCGSNELYWSIFWTGDETSNYGVFPATGNKEGGSAEGHIFCAHCDADWSVFGNEHVYGGGNTLNIISQSVLSSKDAAYMLKNGEMIYS